MSDSDIDKAYDLLVVIIGLIYSTMGSNPEMFWEEGPFFSLEIQAMRSTVFPLIILALLYFTSKLIPNKNGKILLKFVAWMTAFGQGFGLFIAYLHGAKYIYLDQYGLLGELVLMSSFLILPLVVYILIFPQYKKQYPDVTFFKQKVWSILSYVLYLLVTGSTIFLTTLRYVAW